MGENNTLAVISRTFYMKNFFTFTQPRFTSLSWYIWLFIVFFASLGNQCGCSCLNASTHHNPVESPPIDDTPLDDTLPTLSLEFEKIFYDRNNQRLVVIIKNTGKETAKDLSLRCTNISEDKASRTAVRFNNTPTTTILPIAELATGASTEEIQVAIDFQTAKKAQARMEVISGQQVAVTDSVPVNLYPIDLLAIGDTILVAKQGETRDFKWKLVTLPHEEPIDFTKFELEVRKALKEDDIIVSEENIGKILYQSTSSKIISGADLEKLANQQEILITVKNSTNDPKLIYCRLLDNGKQIATITNCLVPHIKATLLPAAELGDVKILKQAIAGGASVNSKNFRKEPVLHLATQGGYSEIVKILLENGADVNAKDNDGNTALQGAAKLQHQEIVETLLTHGADKDIRNNNGETAADLAKDEEIKDLINNWGQ
jgi:hypothetical protein